MATAQALAIIQASVDNILNCGCTASDEDFKKAIILALDCLVDTAIATEDVEIVCASTDGRLLVLRNNAGVFTLTELDGSAIGDGATAVNCDHEFKNIQTCFQDDTDPSIRFTRLVCFDPEDPAGTLVTIWFDASGAIIAAPANVELCDELTQDVEIQLLCDDTLSNGTVIVDFLRHYIREIDGTVTIADTELDGTTVYVVLGTIGPCSTSNSSSVVCLCDNNGAGIITPFLRHIVRTFEDVVTIFDTELDGTTAYVVGGTVEKCDTSTNLFTYGESQVSLTNNTNILVLAANLLRQERSWVQNNTGVVIWLTHTATAVLNQGIKLNINQIYEFSTTQQLRAIQNSGGAVNLDVVEAT